MYKYNYQIDRTFYVSVEADSQMEADEKVESGDYVVEDGELDLVSFLDVEAIEEDVEEL